MKLAAIVSSVFVLAWTQSVDSKPIWKAVPNHRGAFVDVAGIVHVNVSGITYRHCVAGGPPNSCDLPPVDTKADVKIDGAIANGIGFYCKDAGVTRGDMHFGEVGGKDHIFPLNAAQPIVCNSSN